MIDLALDDDERMVLEMVRDFTRAEIDPIAKSSMPRRAFPHEAIDKMRELGLLGPLDSRGVRRSRHPGHPLRARDRGAGALLRGGRDHDLGSQLGRGVSDSLFRDRGAEAHGSCPRLASRDIGAFCLSEAGSGSDAASLSLRAERDRRRVGPERDEDVGHRTPARPGSTSSSRAATRIRPRDTEGITAFLVERGSAGPLDQPSRKTRWGFAHRIWRNSSSSPSPCRSTISSARRERASASR